MSDHVLCVSAGMLAPKKLDTPLARLHRYLNYGLLGLGTLLQHQGYSVRLIHGNFEEPLEFASQITAHGDFERDFRCCFHFRVRLRWDGREPLLRE